MSIATCLVLALLLDAALGEPRWLWDRVPHPVVLMGRVLSALETRLNTGQARRAKGVVVMLVLAFGAVMVGALLASLGGLVTVCAAAVLLSHRALVDHVAAVADALLLSVGDGRATVAMIVGRDTKDMARADVARAAIESAAENFSDGVIAPAFWFAVAGLPGLVLYKMVNTADSMIGHRTPRYAAFGWAAARADDVLNIVPARLTAALFWALTRPRPEWAAIKRDARLHRSPNAGWPEAAMARAVNVALSGPRSYHGQREDHPFVHPTGVHDIGPDHIRAAVRVLWQAWAVMLAVACLVAVI
ncbi:adenosylcobinamide-phosphate synthase CbiB [Rhodobacteraceae bacterium KMM 6894]|nr:adenosylcobinamide-phosphate synthase CbiB [Rhodobacteraceae bacterium KMM 6894]